MRRVLLQFVYGHGAGPRQNNRSIHPSHLQEIGSCSHALALSTQQDKGSQFMIARTNEETEAWIQIPVGFALWALVVR